MSATPRLLRARSSNAVKGRRQVHGRKPATNGQHLPLLRPRNLAEQVANAIVDSIAGGVLRSGQRLVETELAAQLQVSRVPLRESLKMLEAQGILESEPHRGTRVAELDEAKIDHICEARVALERLALRGAMRTYRAQPERIAQLDEIVATMERAAKRLDWAAINQA